MTPSAPRITLDSLARLLDAFATAGKQLADRVAAGTDGEIHAAAARLADAALALERQAPQTRALLASCPPDVRQAWLALIEEASPPVRVGAELATLNATNSAARLAALAHACGADPAYSRSGCMEFPPTR
ncbi:hypothetical protein GCM10023144_12650 [Pigmentiphaga soli]|uniref:Phasin domain-containing protein n=1 Tax=Pigmentiphaga soli TaxID=1007095 RepID=A0ABP8GNX9_9BURK